MEKKHVLLDCDEVRDIKHLAKERDYKTEQLKCTIELNFSEELAREQLENILKLNRELKLLEDALFVGRVTGENKKK